MREASTRTGFIVALLIALLGAFPALGAYAAAPSISVAVSPAMFDTEDAAQKHCPRDVVVWLNTSSGVYHEKGMRWYGRTKRGAFVCKREADAAGDRDTRNGQ